MFVPVRIAALATAVAFAAWASPAQASLIQVFSRAALGSPPLDVNWSIFGAPPTAVSTYAQAPVGPIVVHINTAAGVLNVENSSAVGGFSPGDVLLSQLPGNLSDGVLVGFSTPVSGVGTQIESLLPDFVTGGPNFTGIMDAYNTGGTLLGEVTVAGNKSNTSDGSAPFIGAISTAGDISYVIFTVNNNNPLFPKAGDVAINHLSVDVPASVPEPATLFLGLPALLALGAVRRRPAG